MIGRPAVFRYVGAAEAGGCGRTGPVASATPMDAAGGSVGRRVVPERGPRGAGRRRRPSGEPPPLPRRLGVSGRVWSVLAVSVVVLAVLALGYQGLGGGIDRWSSALLRRVAVVRTGWLTTVMSAINTGVLSRWTARIYLAVDHPTDLLAAVILGVGVPVVAFQFFAPNEVFPVSYRRARAAHLDVGGRRGRAIRAAVQDQLGLTVLEATPIGLEGSAGSTPLRLRVAAADGPPERLLFAKLYARSHVRADRSYKLGRTILYGALEDEAPFGSVRRFVEYEDYTLLLLNRLGIPTPAPFGFVEITPEREYMIVLEFVENALEIGQTEVDDQVIDSGLLLVRRLWDAGLAHRDIKPANLMVRDGQVVLIDVFFVQVRPSPWRQAVDLANMMLVLAVRTDAARVYQHALRYFTDDEIAEAFAAP